MGNIFVACLWLILLPMGLELQAKSPISCHGKFFARSSQKFFFKAMRLDGIRSRLDFDDKLALLRRLEKLKDAHTTGLVLTQHQADSTLELVARAGLLALVELAIAPEEILTSAAMSATIGRVVHQVKLLRGRAGLAGYVVNCPIAQDAVRAHGLERVRRNLGNLIARIRERDEHALVAIRHRADTRALVLLEEDFIYADVSPLDPVELRDYVVSLHNIAEARPLVIEFSEASPGQDEAVAVAFGAGAAGVVAPPVPAPAFGDWLGARTLRASELMPFVTLNGSCPPVPRRAPMVSVVICAYNAERTMHQCLESLRKLDYPDYEVVIVDDGSRDRTAEIATAFPEFRLIRQANRGLSVARNVGLHAARGEIVAYTDSDCAVDPHWLTLMVRAMLERGYDGCGGPNYAPHEDGRVEACVAASPGAPSHVLTAEDMAEHLAGCNMVFRKEALLGVGGFDPQFTAAGDDVDICWRLLDAGFRLGYSPAAFVWHFRRNTIKAYYGQQRGYGRAEAMLYARYPARFNVLGQIKWRGTIPGLARTIPGGALRRVRWKAPRATLPTVFEGSLGLVSFLPQTLEWTVASALALATSLALGIPVLPALAMLLMGPIWALHYAWRAPLEKCHGGLVSRMLVAYLAWTGPMVRTITRYKMRAKPDSSLADEAVLRQKPSVQWLRRSFKLAYWSESYVTRDALVERLFGFFTRNGYPAVLDAGWNDFDLEVRTGPWTRIQLKSADEEHPAGRVKTNVLARVKLSALGKCGLALGVIAVPIGALLSTELVALSALGLATVFTACVLSTMAAAGRLIYRAVESAAAEQGLIPLGAPSRAWVRAGERAARTQPAPAMELERQGAHHG